MLMKFTTTTNNCYAGPQEERAMREIQRAVLAYPVVKKTTKKYTKKAIDFVDYIGMGKTTRSVVGGMIGFGIRGRIDTRRFKYNIKIFDAETKPYVNYDWRNNNAEAGFSLNYDF